MRPMFSILMENPWFLHSVHVFSMEFHDFSMGNPWYIFVREGKLPLYSLPIIRADLYVQAVSPHPQVKKPAEERHRPSTGTKLYCLVIEAHRCEQLSQGCYATSSKKELNPRPIDRKANGLALRHCATLAKLQ